MTRQADRDQVRERLLAVMDRWQAADGPDPSGWSGGHDLACRVTALVLDRGRCAYAGARAAVDGLLAHAADDVLEDLAELAVQEERLAGEFEAETLRAAQLAMLLGIDAAAAWKLIEDHRPEAPPQASHAAAGAA